VKLPYCICALRHIQRVLPQDVAKTLASSIVGSRLRLDYCHAVLCGTPNSTTSKLQKVQNCLARVVLQQRKSCHARPLLKSLHWLPISQRINFKLATLAFKIQSTSQPEYLHQLISSQHSGSSMTLRSSTRPLLQVPRTRTAYGSRAFSSAVSAIFQLQSLKQTVCLFSIVDSRHICSLLLSKTAVNCKVASAFVSVHYV